MLRRAPLLAVTATLLLSLSGLTACSTEAAPQAALVLVPGDVATLQEAADRVAPGGTIEIAAGRYTETMSLSTNDVTVRGADRNDVVIDGEGLRSNGIIASGTNVTVENLTVTSHLVTGILITGATDSEGNGVGRPRDGYGEASASNPPLVPGYTVRYTTVTNNGLYGIYAFNRSNGTITDNYASGGADSGIYVGQCDPCAATVSDNVTEFNAIGLEMANASGVHVLRNRFTDNRVGATVQSNYQEAYLPLRGTVFVGNVIANNNQAATPAVAEGGFGIGLGISSASEAVFERNLITGNSYVGAALTTARDLPAASLAFRANEISGNGIDVGSWASAQAAVSDVCLEPLPATTFPALWPAELGCSGGVFSGTTVPGAGPAPEGISFLDVATPGSLPSLPAEVQADTQPWLRQLSDFSSVPLPAASLLQELTQGQS